jgi:hypothetical protein
MKYAIAFTFFLLSAAAFAAEAPPPVTMTRADAMVAFNTLAAIGQPYKVTVKQGGQDVPVDKFLDVSAPMRSTLIHDLTALKAVAMETVKLEDDAKTRLGNDAAALAKEGETIAQEKVSIDGVITFSENDLALDKNPQISLLQASALAVIEK